MSVTNAHHIVVALDRYQDNVPALSRAAALSQNNTVHVELVYSSYNSTLEHNLMLNTQERQAARDEHIHEQQQWLHGVLTAFTKHSPNSSAQVLYGANPVSGLLAELKKSNADLLIKTPSRHHPLRDLVLLQQDWELIRKCQIALWLPVNTNLNGGVLACIDPLHSADPHHTRDLKIIKTAKEMSELLKAPLNLLHCYSPLPHGFLYDSDPVTINTSKLNLLRQEHQQAITPLLERTNIALSQIKVISGRPEVVIRQQVQELGCSIVVLGATSRSIIDDAVIGHTAERLLHKVDTDLLLCYPERE